MSIVRLIEKPKQKDANKMLGLSTKPETKKKDDKKEDSQATTSQADEAKAILAKMEAKKDAGDCPFC